MIVELLNSEVVNIYSAEPKQRNSNYTYVVAPYEPIEILPTQKKIGLQFINGVVTDVIIDMTAEEIAEANKPIVPQVISRRQFKLALAFLGYNENDILNGIDQLPEPNKTIARISYLESGTFERFSSDLIYVGKNFLQLTDEQIDEVFITGNNF